MRDRHEQLSSFRGRLVFGPRLQPIRGRRATQAQLQADDRTFFGVFHRRGAPFARVRSVTSIDSQPDEQFVAATISQVDDSRDRVEVDIDVPSGDRPALLTFSRPYFRGYQARLGDQKLAVTSYRGLFPVVKIPPGMHGRLTLGYRPYWLIWGGGAAIACALVIALSLVAAIPRGTPDQRVT